MNKNWIRLRELHNIAFGRFIAINEFRPMEYLYEEEQTEYCTLMLKEVEK
jgi:hypothetical protein